MAKSIKSLDEIKFGSSRVTLYDKTLNLQLAIFTKNRQLPNLIPCQIFCLYGIMFTVINRNKQYPNERHMETWAEMITYCIADIYYESFNFVNRKDLAKIKASIYF